MGCLLRRARGVVTEPQRAPHVVIDTDVTSWLLDCRPLPYAQEARRVIGERLRILSFVTVTEMRYERDGVSFAFGAWNGRLLTSRSSRPMGRSSTVVPSYAAERAAMDTPWRRKFTRRTDGLP
jgi:hypothetical protein